MSLLAYVVGLLSVCSFLLLWFVSPLKITLAKIFFKKDIVVPSDFDDLLFLKNYILGKLSSCWICLSFWTSLAVGIILTFIGQPQWFPILTFCTYPSLAYAFKTLIKA